MAVFESLPLETKLQLFMLEGIVRACACGCVHVCARVCTCTPLCLSGLEKSYWERRCALTKEKNGGNCH